MFGDERTARTVEDMNVIGDLFALRFVSDNMVELYVEDDGWFHFKANFNKSWLRDLSNVAIEAIGKLPL